MKPLSHTRAAAVSVCAVAVLAAAASACSSNSAGGGSAAGGGVLTIQGDAGNPTLVENFNPLSSAELGGTRLMYTPLETVSSVNGSYTPFLATGYKFTSPTTLVYTIRSGAKSPRCGAQLRALRPVRAR